MAQATFNFPRGFLWGTSTSSHQVEGNNTNSDWWVWEQQNGRIHNNDRSKLACDWWGGRWKEDLDRAAESNHNVHRLSIEWSRVQPDPDMWDETALDHYREIVRGLVNRKMLPIVTLHHFSNPIWLTEMGGWENENTGDLFVNYVQKVVEALGEYVNIWVTINEPNVLVAYGYLFGLFPPGKSDISVSMQVMSNLVSAHSMAYHRIHSLQTNARVGSAVNYRGFIPSRNWLITDRISGYVLNSLFNDFFPRAFTSGIVRFPFWRHRVAQAKNTMDFLGINYYTREMVKFNLMNFNEFFIERFYKPEDELSDSGEIANAPGMLLDAIKWGLQFNIPIFITENGVDNKNDVLRRKYIIQHIHQVWRAVNFNYPVKGYLHWTLVDNFEWERGWSQRFGLWELDVETQARKKRISADLFAKICQQNCLSSEMVEQYSPETVEGLFPG